MYKCEVCGGKLNMTIGSDIAVCDSCGNRATIPAGDVRKYQDIYKAAELLMQRNSVVGYSEAKMKLQAIAFIPEAEEKIAVCENRIAELRERQKTQAQTKAETDKRDSKTGIILIVTVLLILLAIAAGIIYLAIRFYRGDLSPRTIAIIIAAVVVVIAIAIIGKTKS